MPETVDVDDLMRAAAVAARRNDPAEAAGLLRRVVTLQEQSLGPRDRDLAPTLNNLALMLERQGHTEEAERCYRRAYDIARRGAGPNDPLAQVARANLVEFLQATGQLDPLRDDIPGLDLEAEPPPEPVAPRVEPDAAPPRLILAASKPAQPQSPEPVGRIAPPTAERPRRSAPPPAAPRPQPSEPRQRPPEPPVQMGTGRAGMAGKWKWLVAGLVLAMGVEAWIVVGRKADTEGSVSAEPPAAAQAPVQPPAPAPEPSRATEPPAAAAARETPPQTPPAPAPPVPAPRAAPQPSGAIDAEARLCLTLTRGGGAWQCTPLGRDGSPDAVYFYTRVKTPRDVVIRHRWTHDGAVVQTVNLQVRANAREGFRTFSHQRVAGRPGEWEVALITADGSVVEAQRFTVTR